MTAMIAPGGRGMSSQKGANARGDIIPKGFEKGQLQQFSPEQMQLFKSLFSQVGGDSFLGRLAGGDESQFAQMEEPAMRQFAQQQGSLASRFSGLGLGGRKSSGFQNALGQAGSDFTQNMQSQRQQLQRQALMDMLGLSESLLGQRPKEQFLTEKPEKKRSFIEELILGLTSQAGGLAQAGTKAYLGGM